jgi:hypothetical protein
MRRLTAGGCYEIDGILLRRCEDAPGPVPLARWRTRQADLWRESGTIAHLHHHLTAEESALWTTLWRELQVVDAVVARLESDVTATA